MKGLKIMRSLWMTQHHISTSEKVCVSEKQYKKDILTSLVTMQDIKYARRCRERAFKENHVT